MPNTPPPVYPPKTDVLDGGHHPEPEPTPEPQDAA